MQKIDYEEQYRIMTREPVRVVAYPLPSKPQDDDITTKPKPDSVSNPSIIKKDMSAFW